MAEVPGNLSLSMIFTFETASFLYLLWVLLLGFLAGLHPPKPTGLWVERVPRLRSIRCTVPVQS